MNHNFTIEGNSLQLFLYLIFILVVSSCGIASAGLNTAKFSPPENEIEYHNLKRHPGKIRPNPYKAESGFPEYSVNSTLKLGMKKVLPEVMHRNLEFNAGFDAWKNTGTFRADLFLPVNKQVDRTMFLLPRVNINGFHENVSVSAGYRKVLSPEIMVGFYGFHDWARARFSDRDFLREIGAGIEFSALPGRHSDLTFSANVYMPVSENSVLGSDRDMVIKESLPGGVDAKIKFLFPSFVDFLDIQFDGSAHTYKGNIKNHNGFKTALSLKTRDGMLGAKFEHGTDSRKGEHYKIEGNISLKFDWAELLNGNNPFSAPYKTSSMRYVRKLGDRLQDRTSRKYDFPADRIETKYTLMADVSSDELFVSGGFPDLRNAVLTIQTSQSPWQDFGEVATDEQGNYSASLRLPPGIYQIRMVHKPTGRISNLKTIVVENPPAKE